MRGIILAGGHGTRLRPLTIGTSKQLLPVYDKPMIFYPLSLLITAGIKEICIITLPKFQDNFIQLLGDGSAWGINIRWQEQFIPSGIPEAFEIAGEDWIGDDSTTLILGDNIYLGTDAVEALTQLVQAPTSQAHAFLKQTAYPEKYGVARFDANGRLTNFVEKPVKCAPREWAVTGLYVVPPHVCDVIPNLKPSKRMETEIVDLLQHYLDNQQLQTIKLNLHTAWFDCGNPADLLQASQYVAAWQERHGEAIGCLDKLRLDAVDTTQEINKKVNNESCRGDRTRSC